MFFSYYFYFFDVFLECFFFCVFLVFFFDFFMIFFDFFFYVFFRFFCVFFFYSFFRFFSVFFNFFYFFLFFIEFLWFSQFFCVFLRIFMEKKRLNTESSSPVSFFWSTFSSPFDVRFSTPASGKEHWTPTLRTSTNRLEKVDQKKKETWGTFRG